MRAAHHKLAVDIGFRLAYLYLIILVIGAQCVIKLHGGLPVAQRRGCAPSPWVGMRKDRAVLL
ncbi:hypothetical protein SDC9_183100 [bioreactor metagenome]|uniref:Uncharacterized protein n=1 Tax=bioreactor metagenome TaxID=1076179 RepID=A0A645HB61_9ZZZZ